MSAAGVRGIDGLLEVAGIDPGAGVQIVAADRLPSVAFDPSLPLVVLASTADAAPSLPGRHARTGAHAVLRALYPAAHALLRLSDRSPVALDALDEDGQRLAH